MLASRCVKCSCFVLKMLQNLSDAAPTYNPDYVQVWEEKVSQTLETQTSVSDLSTLETVLPKALFFAVGDQNSEKKCSFKFNQPVQMYSEKEKKQTCEGCWSLYLAYVATGTFCSYCKVFEDILYVQ